MAKRVNFRRVLMLGGIVSLVIAYTLLWLRMLGDPVEYTGTDYVAFFSAGRIASNEGPEHIYNLALQEKYEEDLVGFDIASSEIRPYLHPPFVIPLVQLTLLDGFISSFILWDVTMLVFIIMGAWLITQFMGGEFPQLHTIPFLLGCILFFPSFLALMIGQDNPIQLLGAVLWFLGIKGGKDRQAGLGLALMMVKPHLGLILAIPFFFQRKRVFWWFLVGSSLLSLASVIYGGIEGITGFLKILQVSAGGVGYSTGEKSMVNFIGIVLRLFPSVNGDVVRVLGWVLYLLTTIGLCIVWSRAKQIGEKELSLAVMLALLTVPHVHAQDLALLIIPLSSFLLVTGRGSFIDVQDMPLLPVIISMAMLLSYSSEFLAHNIPYLVMVILSVGIWFPEKVFFWTKKLSNGHSTKGN